MSKKDKVEMINAEFHIYTMNSLASTFKVSCKHEDKVYECRLLEKGSMKMAQWKRSFDLL